MTEYVPACSKALSKVKSSEAYPSLSVHLTVVAPVVRLRNWAVAGAQACGRFTSNRASGVVRTITATVSAARHPSGESTVRMAE